MLRTPLYDLHIELGAQMVDFAGWAMPLRYGSIAEEHQRVRTSGGIFDVSHMGRVRFKGKGATALLDRCGTRDVASMSEGQCRYMLITNENGGVKDDVIVMREGEDEYLVVVNASNREKLLAHYEAVRQSENLDVAMDDRTQQTAMIAVQGPKVMELIGRFSKEIAGLKRFRFTTKNLMIARATIARTGYTGEDGVEVIMPANLVGMALKLLKAEVDYTDPNAVLGAVGLGARDTLRLEAGMPLYGHELKEEWSALSSGMDFAIKLERETPFIGQEALLSERERGGPARRVVGLKVEGRRTPRQGMAVRRGGSTVGEVTSGCMSPTLGLPIAMAMIEREAAGAGASVEVDLGRATAAATVTELPFYKAGR